MSAEDEKIRKILQRGMEEPTTGFSERVMLQIAAMQKAPQTTAIEKSLKPWVFIFALLSVSTLGISFVAENDFSYLHEQLTSSLSIQQMMNIILSLVSFWVLMLISPWIKKQVDHFAG
ncbi:hypothetical protein [Catalinimonas niigatensis]|uniref:hypothetical protein n=1 Tax=Catalinimonas niigatensis TaxID=1397264 RepID=UPI002666260F|nr:hypothetical protein [Catalinimonas niigatensis]WPP49310.1 hypothetical protein PZB72_21820 [Catalinimonas niigatensis]